MALLCDIDGFCPDGFICVGGRCVPDNDNPPVEQLPGLGTYLRARYTSNVVVNNEMTAKDFLFDILCTADRGYFRQNENGKLGMRNKKPVPYAFGIATFNVDDTEIAVDNVADWIDTVDNWLLISPHNAHSEIKRVTASRYTDVQNDCQIATTGGIFSLGSDPNFTGCDDADTPATNSITVTGIGAAPVTCSITINDTVKDTVLNFATVADDTVESIASYLAGIIRTHPALNRRFTVEFDGVDTATLTARFGFLTLDAGLLFAKDAPMLDPVTAPTLDSSGSGTDLLAGVYYVGYSAANDAGETLLADYAAVTITAGKQIDVTTVALPSGATSLKWYISPEANSNKLRFKVENDGTGFAITTLPRLNSGLQPDLNRTGAEVMRVSAVFSDREEERSATSRSNVILASYEWQLGNRDATVNVIKGVYRRASADWQLVNVELKDDANIEKTKKESPLDVNGQAIDNDDQAYRIFAGLLSERQDADFFYKFSATRGALLLQEGDVVTITDNSSGVINFPVILEQIDLDIPTASLPKATFTGRKYNSRLYDDSIVEASIEVISNFTLETVTEALTSTQDWEPPALLYGDIVTAEVWAGGAGGGKGGTGKGAHGGSGGGGGAFAKKASIPVIRGNTYTAHIGTGGTGSTGTNATNGGDSWFVTNTTVLAKGGIAGTDNSAATTAGGLSGSCIGDTKFSGGTGAAGNTGPGGGGGGAGAGNAAPGGNASGATKGTGGTIGGGDAGNGGTASVVGSVGTAPGGAGGGGGNASNGGAGARGQIKLTYQVVVL